jgi:hypothetical protein
VGGGRQTVAMDARENLMALPAEHVVDYEALLHDARLEPNVVLYLRKHLPPKWRDLYVASVCRPTNIVRFACGTFEYVFDAYSELEALGEVPYDQTVEDRVVAVHGISSRADESRNGSRIRGWLGSTGELVGAIRDKGHFIARCIGGRLDLNVFSQDRKLNRGWSPQGKIYRQMERYCQEHPGTFCFSRPIYRDSSSVPRWLEFGVLKDDETLWVEVFENIGLTYWSRS